MKINPQIESKLSDSKFTSISKLIAFQTFQKQKTQRKIIQEQRKNIQLNVANLYRQAKKASKQLNKTQAELIQNLNRKSSKEQQQRLKDEYKKLKEQELNQMRNNNSLNRYMNMLKREQAKRRLMQQNKQMTLYVKQREKYDQKIKKIKSIEQNKINIEKNTALGNTLKLGIQLAKVKNFYEKQCLSSSVRNDLLKIQNRRIQKEKSAIQELTSKKKQLKQLFSKAKQESHKYQTILDVGKHRSFVQMYELVAAKDSYRPQKQKRKKKSYRKKNFSQKKIINSYLGPEYEDL